MATKKLSEALAELQKAASVEGLDVRLVVAGNSSTDNAKTITLQQLLTALNVPTVQTGVVGNNQQYVYSVSTDNTHAVMSGTFKAFQNNGQCLIRHKFWGSTNDYTDGQYTTCEIPKVTTGSNGVFEAAMLVRLRNTTLTEVNSTTDKVVVSYPNYANGSTKSLEISKATTAKAGVMTAEQVSALDQATTDITSLSSRVVEVNSLATEAQRSANSASLAASSASTEAQAASTAAQTAQSRVDALTPYTTTLQNYIVGELGSYDNTEAFEAALINMTKTTHQNGRYFVKVGGVPLFVTFEVLNNAANILCQWVEGAVTIDSNGKIFPNVTTGVRIISRVYSDGVWGEWEVSALRSDIPKPQPDYIGYKEVYIYSHQSDPNRQVLNGSFKIINNNQHKVELQHRLWGSTDFTSAVTKYVVFPTVTTSQQGMMDNYVYARVLNHTIQESGSTTSGVVIHYTNFAASGDRTFTITAASSAKAGVMTTDQYNQLSTLSEYQRGMLGEYVTTDLFKQALSEMPTTHKGKYGRYYARVSGVLVFVTFVALEEDNNTFAQWVEGTFIKSEADGDIYLNNELGVHIIGRVYRDGAWGMWRSTVLDDEVSSSGSSTAKQYLKWDSANHKYTYVATEAESDAVIPIANENTTGLFPKELFNRYASYSPTFQTDTSNVVLVLPRYFSEFTSRLPLTPATRNEAGIMSAYQAAALEDIQSSYKDLGNFASESAALDKIKSLEVCADSNIVHAHLTYANGSSKNTIILIQSIDNTMCRQIIFNKMEAFHRTITFTDASRTAIQTQEDWMFLFGDRLAWSPSQNKYVLSQFGNNYGWDYTDPIPTATSENDGLMSKEDKSLLQTIKEKLEL